MGAGAILALKPPEQSQLTGQEQQQLPQALLVQLQGLTVIPAFLLLQERRGLAVAGGWLWPGGSSSPLPSRWGLAVAGGIQQPPPLLSRFAASPSLQG